MMGPTGFPCCFLCRPLKAVFRAVTGNTHNSGPAHKTTRFPIDTCPRNVFDVCLLCAVSPCAGHVGHAQVCWCLEGAAAGGRSACYTVLHPAHLIRATGEALRAPGDGERARFWLHPVSQTTELPLPKDSGLQGPSVMVLMARLCLYLSRVLRQRRCRYL